MNADVRIFAASVFATAAHAAVGQLRKYTGDPYIVHPAEVAQIVGTVPGATPEMVIAALLHDVVEDTQVGHDLIADLFGDIVSGYVYDLTDWFTPEAYPNLNRAERKKAEAYRYEFVPNAVKTITSIVTRLVAMSTPRRASHWSRAVMLLRSMASSSTLCSSSPKNKRSDT